MTCWFVLVVAFAARAFAALALRPSGDPAAFQPHVVDLDTAPIGELAALPGIGPGRAAAIVLDRVRHGPFPRVDDLTRVPGIGPATVEALRAHARVGSSRNPAGPR